MNKKRGFACIALNNPKSDVNVGGAHRAAKCYGADLLVTSGKRYKRNAADTTNAPSHIPLLRCSDIFDALPYNTVPIAVEITDRAMPITNFVHPERAFYIFGQEDGTLGKKILDRCKYTIYIPTEHCMNLAATVNVVLFDRLMKGSK